jgi:hypothetical protein
MPPDDIRKRLLAKQWRRILVAAYKFALKKGEKEFSEGARGGRDGLIRILLTIEQYMSYFEPDLRVHLGPLEALRFALADIDRVSALPRIFARDPESAGSENAPRLGYVHAEMKGAAAALAEFLSSTKRCSLAQPRATNRRPAARRVEEPRDASRPDIRPYVGSSSGTRLAYFC